MHSTASGEKQELRMSEVFLKRLEEAFRTLHFRLRATICLEHKNDRLKEISVVF